MEIEFDTEDHNQPYTIPFQLSLNEIEEIMISLAMRYSFYWRKKNYSRAAEIDATGEKFGQMAEALGADKGFWPRVKC